MSKVEFEHATFDGRESVRMDYERKLPEHVAWMVTAEMQDGTHSTFPLTGRYKDVRDTCDIGDPVPLFTEAQLREALASHEAVMRQALNLLGPTAPECCGCAAEWNEAIKALEGALK